MNDKLEDKKTFENNEVNRTLYIVVMYKSLFTRDRKIFFCGLEFISNHWLVCTSVRPLFQKSIF